MSSPEYDMTGGDPGLNVLALNSGSSSLKFGLYRVGSSRTIGSGLSWIGVSLDEARNRSTSNPINHPASRRAVRVHASQEDEQIARHTRELLRRSRRNS